MKKFKWFVLISLVFIASLSSCSLEKRRHLKGYHIRSNVGSNKLVSGINEREEKNENENAATISNQHFENTRLKFYASTNPEVVIEKKSMWQKSPSFSYAIGKVQQKKTNYISEKIEDEVELEVAEVYSNRSYSKKEKDAFTTISILSCIFAPFDPIAAVIFLLVVLVILAIKLSRNKKRNGKPKKSRIYTKPKSKSKFNTKRRRRSR